MKNKKTFTYMKDNGQRTTLTISEKQLEILERLRKFHGFKNKAEYVEFMLKDNKKNNASMALRDLMIGELLGIVKMMGVNI